MARAEPTSGYRGLVRIETYITTLRYGIGIIARTIITTHIVITIRPECPIPYVGMIGGAIVGRCVRPHVYMLFAGAPLIVRIILVARGECSCDEHQRYGF
jgi:hypothetical protein